MEPVHPGFHQLPESDALAKEMDVEFEPVEVTWGWVAALLTKLCDFVVSVIFQPNLITGLQTYWILVPPVLEGRRICRCVPVRSSQCSLSFPSSVDAMVDGFQSVFTLGSFESSTS